METIKNYLDAMFAQLPSTQSVLNAKEELWQMMEDKYAELISEGKTENEAVGTVIAEFGNLSELAEALGLEQEVKEQKEEEVRVPSKMLTVDDAKAYLKKAIEQNFKLALGIAIILFSFVPPIVLDTLLPDYMDGVEFISFSACLAVGILFIVFSRIEMKPWAFLRKEKCVLSMDATKYVHAELGGYLNTFRTQKTAGILFCVLFFIPCIIIDEFVKVKELADLAGAVFFIFIGVGVFLIVNAVQSKKAYTDLLKLNGEGTVGANYRPEDFKVEYVSTAAEAVLSVYWITVTCLYLMISFVTNGWLYTGLIWPVAAVVKFILDRAWIKRAED